MTPWSVIAMAGIPWAAADCMSSSIRLAPSSIEYSVCVWMWTKLSDNLFAAPGEGQPDENYRDVILAPVVGPSRGVISPAADPDIGTANERAPAPARR